jgi:polyhydroxybutyrate depolymerase
MRLVRRLAVLSAVVLAACGGGSSPSGSVSPPATFGASAAPSASPAVSPAPAESTAASPSAVAILDEPVFTFDGDARRVRLYRPPATPAGKVPLLLFLHPSGETPAAAVTETGFDRLAAAEGFIAAFPPSSSSGWAAQVTPGLSDSAVDEVWLTKFVDRLLATERIDPTRVFVAGFSKGAVMTERLACVIAGRIAGAVLVGGAPWVGGECRPSKPVSILFVHGTADSTLRISGARKLADQWRSLDGCEPAPSPIAMGNAASVQTNDRCRGGTAVEFVTVQDGSHTWFTEPDITALAWGFLTEHASP